MLSLVVNVNYAAPLFNEDRRTQAKIATQRASLEQALLNKLKIGVTKAWWKMQIEQTKDKLALIMDKVLSDKNIKGYE